MQHPRFGRVYVPRQCRVMVLQTFLPPSLRMDLPEIPQQGPVISLRLPPVYRRRVRLRPSLPTDPLASRQCTPALGRLHLLRKVRPVRQRASLPMDPRGLQLCHRRNIPLPSLPMDQRDCQRHPQVRLLPVCRRLLHRIIPHPLHRRVRRCLINHRRHRRSIPTALMIDASTTRTTAAPTACHVKCTVVSITAWNGRLWGTATKISTN